MSSQNHKKIADQIRDNPYMTDEDRAKLYANYKKSYGGDYDKNLWTKTKEFQAQPAFKQVLGDVKREGKQRQSIISEQFKLLQGNVNTGLTRSWAGSLGAQKIATTPIGS